MKTTTEKLVTQDAPADDTNRTIIIDEVLSTGFAADNITRTLAPGHALAEGATFAQARTFAKAAAYRMGVIEGDLERHIRALNDGVRIRTPEMQASLTVADIDKAIAELRKARDVLDGSSGFVGSGGIGYEIAKLE